MLLRRFRSSALPALALLLVCPLPGDDDLRTYAEHPRLLLNTHRLRLLRREKERQSPRYVHLETLYKGGVQFPEPGLVHALMYQVTQAGESGRAAGEWAAGPGSDLRQLALVYDWCLPALSAAQRSAIEAKMLRMLAAPAADDLQTMRARTFAAIALDQDGSQTGMLNSVWKTWVTRVAPDLKAGKRILRREEIFPLMELLHVWRDNFQIDAREQAPAYFQTLPGLLLLGYYPAVYPAAENDFRIPAEPGGGEPDLQRAARARAADLSLVAFESNAVESQFLQGWLLNDRFNMKGSYGAPYEFLWANPYQPGLSYYHMPLRFHDPRTGTIFLRSSWDEDARWFGYFEGKMQVFENGTIKRAGLPALRKGVEFGPLIVLSAASPNLSFQRPAQGAKTYFVLGLEPKTWYDIEVDSEEMYDSQSDSGGTLLIDFAREDAFQVRIHPPKLLPKN